MKIIANYLILYLNTLRGILSMLFALIFSGVDYYTPSSSSKMHRKNAPGEYKIIFKTYL